MTCAYYTDSKAKRAWLGRNLLLKYGTSSIIVKVNDNGGFRPLGNSIDLTPAAFKALGGKLSQGKIKVEIYAK